MSAPFEQRLRMAGRAFALSAALSAAGTALELAVYALYNSLILLSDLAHWAVDTLMEVVLAATVYYAGRAGRRYPLSAVIMEVTLGFVAAFAVLAFYVYALYDYATAALASPGHPVESPVPALAALGGLGITLIMYAMQKKNYERYRIELLRYDSSHALLDALGSASAAAGILLASATRSRAIELVIAALLTSFVLHSIQQIVGENLRVVTGRNVDYELKSRLLEALSDVCQRYGARLGGVEARKIGSFYVVTVDAFLDPGTTIAMAAWFRKKVVARVREVSDLVYHVDVRLHPDRQAARAGKRLAQARRERDRGGA